MESNNNYLTSTRFAFIDLDQLVMNPKKQLKRVFLDVQPVTPQTRSSNVKNNEIIYTSIKPMIFLLKTMGILPLEKKPGGKFRLSPLGAVYSIIFFILLLAYVIYSQWNNEILNSSEGKFEDAAINYLFLTHLVPIILIPVAWYETKKIGECLNLWSEFEKMYRRVNGRQLSLDMGGKPLILTSAMVIIGFGMMVVIHFTMAPHFDIVQVLPYCFINTMTYAVAGYWYLICTTIAKVSKTVSDDFQNILRHVGPSSKVAEFRSLWLRLAKITRNVGVAQCYVLTLLFLYLFLTITLSIYGLLSQLQSGLSTKDVGLAVTSACGILSLFFLCDEAHYCAQKVRDNFQKQLLTVELSWMSDDAQQEISMFIRATEMNSTGLSLAGFFDINRTLFKSLMATMVTYLVVLLQFQISIPTDNSTETYIHVNATEKIV